MPIPPALAARLAKRGIIQKQAGTKGKDPASSKRAAAGGLAAAAKDAAPEEEVFAENYDDADEHKVDSSGAAGDDYRGGAGGGATAARDRTKFMGYPGCPNKWNPYHDCVIFCHNHWGAGQAGPDPEYSLQHKNMINKYGPLPGTWEERFDPGTGRHYYWCTKTDRVSWFPPGHPKQTMTEAASMMREQLSQLVRAEDLVARDAAVAAAADDADAMELDSDMESSGDSDEEEDRRIEERRRREKEKRREEQERYKYKQTPKREAAEAKIDPMDPAAYSNAPRGAWSSGLAENNKKE